MALKWFNTAIESGGFEEAKTFKAELLKRMTRAQIAEAEEEQVEEKPNKKSGGLFSTLFGGGDDEKQGKEALSGSVDE